MLLNFKAELRREADYLSKQIPDQLLSEMKAWKFGENTITPYFACNVEGSKKELVRVEWLSTKWEVGPHVDPSFPRWCYFFVIRNPGFYLSSIKNWRFCRLPYQGPGAILGLDLHQLHWLATRDNKPIKDPTWFSLTFSSEKLIPKKEVVRRFTAAAQHLIG